MVVVDQLNNESGYFARFRRVYAHMLESTHP